MGFVVDLLMLLANVGAAFAFGYVVGHACGREKAVEKVKIGLEERK